MAVYDNRGMSQMRRDAMRRSMQMYGIENQSYTSSNENKSKAETVNSVHENKSTPDSPRNSSSKSEITELLRRLSSKGLDSDKLMIIALMVILAREGADIKLILALGYILI